MKKLVSEASPVNYPDPGSRLRHWEPAARNFLHSVWYAAIGISYFFRSERNARIQLMLAALSVVAGILLGLDKTEWIVIVICIVLVFALEMVNTALEELCNLLTTEFHPAVKIIKDLSAGAVATVALGSAATGLAIFLPKLIERIQ